MKIAIIGGGTFGISLASLLCKNNHIVTVKMKKKEDIDYIKKYHKHKNLPDVKIPSKIKYTLDMSEACIDKDMVVFAVPSTSVREVSREAFDYIQKGTVIVDVAKGIEKDTYLTMSGILGQEMKKKKKRCDIVALTGPTHAEEVAMGLPTLIVAASKSEKARTFVQKAFMNKYFRVYTNNDIKGCEICGAFKNILALSCGIAEGVGYGDNTKAAIMTRGMLEMIRLGKKMGCNKKTFYGLAGVGDLIVTCTSKYSRNNNCGKYIGQGLTVKNAIKKVGMVVEGINALSACVQYMEKYKINMPITRGMDLIINKGADPKKIMLQLMTRKENKE